MPRPSKLRQDMKARIARKQVEAAELDKEQTDLLKQRDAIDTKLAANTVRKEAILSGIAEDEQLLAGGKGDGHGA